MAKSAQFLYDRGLANFQAYCKTLKSGALKKIHSQAAYTMARKVAALVRAKYKTYDDVKPGGWTHDAKILGKEAGETNPARLPMEESDTGLGLIASNVECVAEPNGYLIRVNPSAMHPTTGKLLRHLAYWIENPVPRIIQDTLRALVYRIMIQEKRGGYGTRKVDRHIANTAMDTPIVYNPPQRPVWKAVAQDIAGREILQTYVPDLRRRLRALARSFGAK